MSRRALLGLTLLFLLLRGLVVLCAADRVGEPDAAETKLMEIGDRWSLEGAPSVGDVVRTARAGRNAPHGGFLPVSLAYAGLSVPRGATGSIGALKLVAIAGAAAGFVAWVVTATRLGGPAAGWLLAVLLLLPPPALLGGQLVAWGSHAEVPWLLGGAAWAATRAAGDRRSAILVGLLCGAAAAFDLLALPLALVLLAGWALDRREHAAVAAGAAVAPLAAGLWLTGGLGASVTEAAGNEPTALLGGVAALGLTIETAAGLLPLPFTPDAIASPVPDWLLTACVLLGAALTWRGDDATRWRRRLWLIGAPLLFLAALAVGAPRRPVVAVRYLLPVWPFLLAALAVGAAGRFRALRALPMGVAALGLLTLAPLLALPRVGGFAGWDPARYTAADIGHVTFDMADDVAILLDQLGPRAVLPGTAGSDAPGLALVLGGGAADCLLLEGPHRFAPELVAERLDRLPPMKQEERARLHRQVGWGLALVYREQTADRLAILSRMEPDDRAAAEAGLTEAMAWLAP